MTKISLQKLQTLKSDSKRFATITAYDASFAQLIAAAGIECLLVGDSLGNVIQGQQSTVPVTIDDMCYHTQCVHEGLKAAEFKPFIISDMPFMSYASPDQALANAAELMQAGAQMVKLEGGDWLVETVAALTQRGISVCSHLGLTPQSVDALGGYRVQAREQTAADKLLADARALEEAGAGLLVLECIPTDLGRRVKDVLSIPVIGIGAGPYTDSQVLVLYDMLGMNQGRVPRFVKNYMESQSGGILAALKTYHEEVLAGYFPAPEHCYDQ
jgi:3-methyl-2-oxobutanoate hydroxymethyltransferase